MNNAPHRRALKLSVGLILVALISACSGSDKPSESEAKQAVEAELGNCQYIDVQNFKRLNGIPQQDGSYDVLASYTLDINPTDDIKDYINTDYKSALDDATQKVAAAKQFEDELHRKLDAWQKANYPFGDPRTFYASLTLDDAQTHIADANILNSDPVGKLQAQARQKAHDALEQACPNTPEGFIRTTIYDNNVQVEDLGNDLKREVGSVEIHMIKTDNGWQLAQ